MEACIECNLDPYKWVMGLYPKKFRAKIIAYYTQSQLVDAHKESAKAQGMK